MSPQAPKFRRNENSANKDAIEFFIKKNYKLRVFFISADSSYFS